MNIEIVAEGFAQLLDLRDLGQETQLDLRIVGGDELMAFDGDEGAPDLAPFFAADRNILQVRLGRREPAGGRGRQCVAGVDAVGRGIDVVRECLGIGRAELRHLPPIENLARQLVALLGQFVEGARARGPGARLGLGPAGQAKLSEENVP